ncbi:MAG: acyltransferase [Erysipelotrichaceae bacterium]|nr:acyltransferase [Erysipelotrichaceae bacterium]
MNKYEFLKKHPKLNEVILNRRNNIKITGGNLYLDNPHFAGNKIMLSGAENSVKFENDAYMRYSGLNINGKKNSMHVKNGTIITGGSQIVIKGDDNIIEIGENCSLTNIDLHISGDRNYIVIGSDSSIVYTAVMMERYENKVYIGQKCTFHGRENARVSLHLDEKTTITIGNDCMISNAVHLMSTDSHTIMDLSGKRLNKAEDIHIGNHCWICMRVLCMKGTQIGSDSVVGAASVVNKKYDQEHCLIAGNPAKVVREDISWDRERLE